MITVDPIYRFLAAEKIAVAGASRNKKKFGRIVYDAMKRNGYNVVPINPTTDAFEEEPCYKDVLSLPNDVKHLYIITSKDSTLSLLKQAKMKNISQIWIQQMSENKECLKYAELNNMNVISKQCMMMFADQTGIHKFHFRLKQFFGRLPKN